MIRQSNQINVLTSERKITVAGYKCRDCHAPAEFFWPGVGDKPEPYCKEDLEKRKHALAVALGIASY